MKKLVALILALTLALTLAACGQQAQQDPGKPADPTQSQQGSTSLGDLDTQESSDPSTHVMSDETLRVILDDEPNVLTPQYSSPSSPGLTVGKCLFDTLFAWDRNEKIAKPCLATGYEWIDDTHIRIQLREGVKAWDGSEMTAEDVLFTLEFGNAGTNTNYGRLFVYDDTVIENDYSIVLALASPYPNIVDILCNQAYGIISKSLTEAAGGIEAATRNANIGFGRYTFDSWVDSQYIRVIRNDNYWDADNVPYYKYIDFTFNADTATRSMALQSGDADVVFNLSATQLQQLNGTDGIAVYGDSSDCALALYMNCSIEPFSNEKVRQAISLLIDRAAITSLVYGGFVQETETFISAESQYYSAPATRATPDVEGAKALLAEAGYADGFTLDCMIVAKNLALAELIQAQLSLGGIDMQISTLEFPTMMGNLMTGEYEMYLTDISSSDPARLLIRVDGRLSLTAAAGGCQYNDDDLNALIDTALYQADFQTRYDAYAGIQDYIREHNILVGLCSEIVSAAYSSDLTGVSFDPSDFPDVSGVRPIGK